MDEVTREIKAQIEWFRTQVGADPTHVDGHQHVHVWPHVAPIVARVMRQSGLCAIRVPDDVNKTMPINLWLTLFLSLSLKYTLASGSSLLNFSAQLLGMGPSVEIYSDAK